MIIADLNKALDKMPKVSGSALDVGISRGLKDLWEKAAKEAEKFKDEYLSTEHFLLALTEAKGSAGDVLRGAGAQHENVMEALVAVRGNQRVTDQDPEGKYEALDRYTRDLTKLAQAGKLDPVIGRDEEIRRTIQILSRRTKNNPVLVGEAGVGKTAVVEGIAAAHRRRRRPRVAARQAPALARPRRAGRRRQVPRRVRGPPQGRPQGDRVLRGQGHPLHRRAAHPGRRRRRRGRAGRRQHAQAGARPRRAALHRRDHARRVPEAHREGQGARAPLPAGDDRAADVEDTIAILRGLKEKYEVHHGIRIRDAALVAAAKLSHRYITARQLPDKAIDLIDEAASRLKMEIESVPTPIDNLERRVVTLEIEKAALEREKGDKRARARLPEVEREIAELREQIVGDEGAVAAGAQPDRGARTLKEQVEQQRTELEKLTRQGDFARASEIRFGTLPELERKLAEVDARIHDAAKTGASFLREEVTEEDVASVVAKWTGIPVEKMLEGELDKLNHMEDRLRQRVVGQDAAIGAVAAAVRRSRAGLQDPNRPIGSFLFLGPTGVGKTELARALAEFLFDDDHLMVRIDMSEYQEKHTVSRLVGAPPGYVGYDEGGQLTEAVRRHPYSVVLLDEMEKAHPDVWSVLLQVLDDGRLTDAQGRMVDFRNTVVIMTSNVGSQHLIRMSEENRKSVERAVMDELRQTFRPEFLNRIDETILFEPLAREQLDRIVRIQLARYDKLLAERGLELRLTDRAVALVADRGYDPVYGARPLKRAIQKLVIDPLASEILAAHVVAGDRIVADAAEGGETLEFKKEAGTASGAAA